MSDAAPLPAVAAKPVAETLALLKSQFPALFAQGAKPLKLRIQHDIQERAPGQFSKQELSAALRRYTQSFQYLQAVAKGGQRFDLDGQAAGELAEEHRAAAREELDRRRAKSRERAEAEEGERRERQVLLRAFETTTLTLTNFCALKGVTEEELNQRLALAREERAAMPPRPERPMGDRRDRRHDRQEPRGRAPNKGPRNPR